jgi:hypothetical protein
LNERRALRGVYVYPSTKRVARAKERDDLSGVSEKCSTQRTRRKEGHKGIEFNRQGIEEHKETFK